jgi:type III restriction enzyme
MSAWYTGKPCKCTLKSHVNFCVYDSTWEASEAYALDHHAAVAAWVKNDHLGFEVLALETKGQDTEQDRVKRQLLDEWVNAVNTQGGFGRWRWAVIRQPGEIKDVFARCAMGA